MTEIQQTNVGVANFIAGELHKMLPFDLVLDAGETGALYEIAVDMRHLNSDFVLALGCPLYTTTRARLLYLKLSLFAFLICFGTIKLYIFPCLI